MMNLSDEIVYTVRNLIGKRIDELRKKHQSQYSSFDGGYQVALDELEELIK